MMTFKTAVFTAEHGYKWTTPPEGITESQLSRYGKTVDQAYREGMGASDYIQGLIYDGSLVVVFSALRTGSGWDSTGRAARYYALTFIERKYWAQVNFDVLLRNSFFLTPDRNPPKEIVYDGPVSSKVDEEVLPLFANGGNGPERIDFACLGNFLSIHFQLGLNWQFYRSNIPNWRAKEIVFEKNLMSNVFTQRTASMPIGKVSTTGDCDAKENTTAEDDAISSLLSSEIARLSVKLKCVGQDIDANRGQLQTMSQKIRILIVAVVLLLIINIGLAGVILFRFGLLDRMQQYDGKCDSLQKLGERLNRRDAKKSFLMDVSPTNTLAVGSETNASNTSAAKQDGNESKK